VELVLMSLYLLMIPKNAHAKLVTNQIGQKLVKLMPVKLFWKQTKYGKLTKEYVKKIGSDQNVILLAHGLT